MTLPTRQIIAAIRADGFCVNACTYPPALGGHVLFTAWRNINSEVRPPGAEIWTGKGPTRYLAAVALAEALDWDLE